MAVGVDRNCLSGEVVAGFDVCIDTLVTDAAARGKVSNIVGGMVFKLFI